MTDTQIQTPDLPTHKSPDQLAGDQVPAMVFDVARYQHLLDDPSVSPEDSEAFLKAIWDIIVLVLDFGLRVEFSNIHPQEPQNRSKELDAALEGMLKSKDIVLIDKNEGCRTKKRRSVKGNFDESC